MPQQQQQTEEDILKQYGGTLSDQQVNDLLGQYGGSLENAPIADPRLFENPRNPYAYTTPSGIPVYQAAPLLPEAERPKQQPPPEGTFLNEAFTVPVKQLGSGVMSSVAGGNRLAANIADLLDTAAQKIAELTGTQKGGLFKHIEDWARNQQLVSERQAAELSEGRQDLASQLYRTVGGAATSLPTYAVATALGGPVGGMAALGALETEDQGWKNMLMGAATGAATGGALHVMGPASRPLRISGTAAMTYAQLRAAGVDRETALRQALTQGGLAGLGPGGGPGLREMAGNIPAPLREMPGNLAGKVLPAVSPERSAAAQDVINQGEKYNVRLSAGDISQSPSLKNMEVGAEQVPGLGMRKFREEQQQDVQRAAAGLKSKYEQSLLDTDPSSVIQLQKAAEEGDQRARNVLEKMNQAGNDPDRIIQASIGLGDWTTRQTAKDLYDYVQNLAEEHNLGDVPLNKTGKAIGSSLQELRPAKLPNKAVIRLLSDIKESISPKVDSEGKPIVDANGNPVKPNNSYRLIRQLHSDLGDQIREYYQGNNALIGEKGVGYLERVQHALEDDMRDYAAKSSVPEIVEAGKTADSYYKSARVPYKNGMLAAAATSSEPDQVFQQFIKAGKGDRAKNFYDALDDRGKAAVRYNMVAKALEDSTNPQSGIFSPQKFFTAVDKLEKAYDVFFTAKDRAEIQGFKNLMGHVIRAGQYAENPPTGQRAIPFILGGLGLTAAQNAAAHPFITGGGAALFGLTRGLLTTVKGRQWLLRAQGIKPGTPLMESVWQHVGEELPKTKPPEPPEGPGGAPAGGPEGPQEPPQGPGGSAASGPEGPQQGGTAPPSGQQAPGTFQSLYDKLQEAGDAARERIRKSLGTTLRADFGFHGAQDVLTTMAADAARGAKTHGAKINTAIRDMGEWGAARIFGGELRYPEWKQQMLKDAAELSPAAVEFFKANAKAIYASARQTLKDRMSEMGTPPDLKKIFEYADAGMDAKEWYDHARPQLEKIFGPHTDLFLHFLAATSPQTKVAPNVEQALQAYREYLAGEPFSTNFEAHRGNLERSVRGEPLSGLKVNSFIANLLGDKMRTTVDTWMAQAYGLGIKSKAHLEALSRGIEKGATLSDPQYRFVDYAITQAAKERGIDPRQMQAAIWVGIKRMEGNPKYTHAPFQEVLRDYLAANPDLAKQIRDAVAEAKKASQK